MRAAQAQRKEVALRMRIGTLTVLLIYLTADALSAQTGSPVNRPGAGSVPNPAATQGQPANRSMVNGAVSAKPVANRPAPPAPPSEYLRTAARLYNQGEYWKSSKYLRAAYDYRDLLNQDEQVMLDVYIKALRSVPQQWLVQPPAENPGTQLASANTKQPNTASTKANATPATVAKATKPEPAPAPSSVMPAPPSTPDMKLAQAGVKPIAPTRVGADSPVQPTEIKFDPVGSSVAELAPKPAPAKPETPAPKEKDPVKPEVKPTSTPTPTPAPFEILPPLNATPGGPSPPSSLEPDALPPPDLGGSPVLVPEANPNPNPKPVEKPESAPIPAPPAGLAPPPPSAPEVEKPAAPTVPQPLPLPQPTPGTALTSPLEEPRELAIGSLFPPNPNPMGSDSPVGLSSNLPAPTLVRPNSSVDPSVAQAKITVPEPAASQPAPGALSSAAPEVNPVVPGFAILPPPNNNNSGMIGNPAAGRRPLVDAVKNIGGRIRDFIIPDGRKPAAGVNGKPAMAYNPDNTLLASADGPNGEITVWNTANRQKIVTLPGASWSKSAGACLLVAFSPDGRQLVSVNPQGLIVHDLASSKGSRWELQTKAAAISFSADGTTISVSTIAGDTLYCKSANGEVLGALTGTSRLMTPSQSQE